MLSVLSLLANWPSIILATIVAVYFYTTRNYNYWKSRGVNGPKPLPLIGNLGQLFVKPRPVQMVEDYNKFGKIYGIYEGSTPVLMIAEPELIKNITIRDFHKFVDRGLPPFGNPMFDRSLINARGEQWKQVRVTVSPTFSSGKMRRMHKLIEECVERLDTAFTKEVGTEIDLKKLFINYTMDVIAYCAFATKIETHNSGAEQHPFIQNAQKFLRPSLRALLFFLSTAVAPKLVKKYNFAIVSSDVFQYFETIINSIMKQRESQEGKYVDFLQLLVEEKKKIGSKDIDEDIKREVEMISDSMKKKGYQLEDIDILASALFFILAGSETTATLLSHLFYELAMNPSTQEKLYEEIISCGGNLDYDTISQLKYLDAAVNETLRKYPAVVFNQRQATEDTQLGDTGIEIPKNMIVRYPIYALHHDPQYFPNPEKFDPERFMPENKSKLTPYSFIPFGFGPRSCIGMRFALMTAKTAIVTILAKYQFSQTANTITNFEFKKFVVFAQEVDMGTIRLERRK